MVIIVHLAPINCATAVIATRVNHFFAFNRTALNNKQNLMMTERLTGEVETNFYRVKCDF